jgi:thiol-disulfide isomerase/thioredoxin
LSALTRQGARENIPLASKETSAMGQRVAFPAACLAILSVSLCAGQDSSVFVIPERVPEPAFTLPDLNGRAVSSKEFAGKVAVVSFGATWCASCVSELKSLERLQARFPNDLIVYFVALDGRGEKDVKPFMDKHGFRVATLIDPRMAVAREHDIRWVPVTVVVDRQGVMVGRAIGPRAWDGKEALDLVQSLMKR